MHGDLLTKIYMFVIARNQIKRRKLGKNIYGHALKGLPGINDAVLIPVKEENMLLENVLVIWYGFTCITIPTIRFYAQPF